MKFSKFSEYLERLEATPKRLELIDIMSKLLADSDAAEVGKICYLLQGRVAPFYEPTEFGMSENLVAVAIGRAYGPTSPRLRGVKNTKEEVIKLYRKLGNMGLAAQQLAAREHPGGVFSSEAKNHPRGESTVSEVFEKLLAIAKFSGEGTVDKKVSALSDLLKSLDPKSVKHVVNIPLGTLRLGIGDPTVMDALSIAKTGDKKLRPLIEDAYNKTSDFGYVAEKFFEEGAKGLEHVRIMVGKPVRPALAERMPNADEVVKRMGGEFAVEPKFDGFRVQIHKNGNKVEIFSRNLEDMTNSFPDLAAGVLREVKAKSIIMEGEAIAYNPLTAEFLPFQETTKRRRKYKVEETAKTLPLVCFAFDILYLDGEDITGKTEVERRKLLEKVVSKENLVIRIAEQRIISTAKEIGDFFNEAVSEGLEGLMIKKLDAPYKAGGRGFHWIKFKRASSGELTDTVDVVLLGIYVGKGKRTEFGVGGLLVGIYNKKDDVFESISRLGTGLTDAEFRHVNEIGKKLRVDHKPARVRSKVEPSYWVEPEVVMEVYADEITKSPIHVAGWDKKTETGYALRFPRLVKFRESDKRGEDATTVDELKRLFENQYKKK